MIIRLLHKLWMLKILFILSSSDILDIKFILNRKGFDKIKINLSIIEIDDYKNYYLDF